MAAIIKALKSQPVAWLVRLEYVQLPIMFQAKCWLQNPTEIWASFNQRGFLKILYLSAILGLTAFIFRVWHQ